MKRFFCALFAAFLLLSAVPAETEFMALSVDDIFLQIPESWSVAYLRTPCLLFMQPLKDSANNEVSVSVVVEPYVSGIDELGYLRNSRTQLRKLLSDFTLEEEGGYYQIYTATVGGTSVCQIQSVFIYNDRYYVLTCSAPREIYDDFEPDFISIINSVDSMEDE